MNLENRVLAAFTDGRIAEIPVARIHKHRGIECWNPSCSVWEIAINKGEVKWNPPDSPTIKDVVSPRQKAEKQLRHVWDELNRVEMEKVIPKAIEYGSGDLKLMGYAMKMLLNSPRARSRDWTEAESMEIAIAFYTLGKVAREFSAFEMGNMPSEDQPHDIGVYQRMAQIIRKEGSWPPGFEEYLRESE